MSRTFAITRSARFGDLVRPLRVVAANLAILERVVFSSDEVATGVV